MAEGNGLEISETSAGTVVKLKVLPGSKKPELRGVIGGRLKVAVTAAPEKGKANKAVLILLAKHLGVSKSQLEIISGLTEPQKSLLVKNMDRLELESRLSKEDP